MFFILCFLLVLFIEVVALCFFFFLFLCLQVGFLGVRVLPRGLSVNLFFFLVV